MFAIIWRYEVKEEARAAFQVAYGPTGAWAQLFARSAGFRGTELLRADDGSYLTLDVWGGQEDFDSFMVEHGSDYQALDRGTEGWTRSEHRIGSYQVLS